MTAEKIVRLMEKSEFFKTRFDGLTNILTFIGNRLQVYEKEKDLILKKTKLNRTSLTADDIKHRYHNNRKNGFELL